MLKMLTLSIILLIGVTTYKVNIPKVNDINNLQTSIHSNSVVMDLKMPITSGLSSSEEAIKLQNADSTITLEAKNTLVLSGPVTSDSVAKLQSEANAMSSKLKDGDKIYLVLDTPGGSVFAGMDLIDHLRALPQKIETITLFAASMGFQIAQNMDTRYITPSGTLMSHRARGGVQGQFDGELESQYNMIKRKLDYLDAIASKRMGISVKVYKALIKDEYWVSGFDAKAEKAADKLVNIRCGKSLRGKKKGVVSTMFGNITVTVSKCPTIRGILDVGFESIAKENISKVKNAVLKGYNNKTEYVREFITTGDHYKMFP